MGVKQAQLAPAPAFGVLCVLCRGFLLHESLVDVFLASLGEQAELDAVGGDHPSAGAPTTASLPRVEHPLSTSVDP